VGGCQEGCRGDCCCWCICWEGDGLLLCNHCMGVIQDAGDMYTVLVCQRLLPLAVPASAPAAPAATAGVCAAPTHCAEGGAWLC
jgi:hypothetical protein